MTKNILAIICSISLISCSPLYTLFVQNNSEKPIEVYVELKNEKYTRSFKKVFEKSKIFDLKSISLPIILVTAIEFANFVNMASFRILIL